MLIRTTALFKIRRLSGYSRKLAPELKKQGNMRMGTLWNRLQTDRLEREIFNSCIVLKNLAIVHRNQPMSCDFMLEQLMECSRPLQTVYADILSAWRSGRGRESFDILYQRIPVKAARHFSFVLSRIDQVNPAELIGHMDAFEETFASERMTKGMQRAERRSLVTTMAAAATIFAILLNFTVVVVFMDTLQMLGQVF
ncbi:MAG: hypothetical protein ACI4LA_10235 [Emergencia sp.]